MSRLPPVGETFRERAAERRARARDERRRREQREAAAAAWLRALEVAATGLDPRDRAVFFPQLERRRTRPPVVQWEWAEPPRSLVPRDDARGERR